MATEVGAVALRAYSKTQADKERLRDDLFQQNRYTAEEALLQQAQSVGCGLVTVKIPDGDLTDWIRDGAEWAAKSICATYNNDLGRAIDKILEDDPLAGKGKMSQLLMEWEAGRQRWKSNQIAITEAFKVANEAKMQFWLHNSLREPSAWFGYSTQCEDCKSIAMLNPYTLKDAHDLGLPHPGCLDEWHLMDGEAVKCSELWLGE